MAIRKIDFWGATSMVVANMVGTGVFTSLGFQLFDIHTGFSIIMIWLIGGILALLGAFCYAEVSSRLPEDGGEFYFLTKIYHPAIGYMAGFVSSTVGFAAPIAGASLALGAYVHGFYGAVNEKLLAVCVIVIISLIHIYSMKLGLIFQKISTLAKVLIILIFVSFGYYLSPVAISFAPTNAAWNELFHGGMITPAFAISLVWVSFAYSGWNASSYIAGSIENPEKNLSKSILLGTSIVIVLYVLLNAVFLLSTPMSELVGNKEIGLIAAKSLLGNSLGNVMGGIISLLLISTISSMIFTGPRVMKSMFSSIPKLIFLGKSAKDGTPRVAIITQSILSLILMYTMNFESLIYYVAFTLSLFTLLTVFGLFILRYKQGKPSGYKAWGYPFTPIVFLVMTSGVAYYFIKDRPIESILGLSTSVLGLIFYFLFARKKSTQLN